MLRIYRMPNGKTYQFEESSAPKAAVLIEEPKVEKKAVTPQNKAKVTKNKSK